MTESRQRYRVDQLYIGNFLVVDSKNENEVVAICPYLFDMEGTDKEIECDAGTRADAIAAALNLSGFDWKPLPIYDPYSAS